MAQIAKMEVQTEIKSSPEKVYDIFRNKLHLLPKICPQQFKECKVVVRGDSNSVGSVRVWTPATGDPAERVKETTVAVDDGSKTMSFNMLEGEMMKNCKTFRPTVTVARCGQGSMVKWTVEFEKVNDTVPDPIDYKDFLINWSNNMDAYLLNAHN